MPITDRVIFNLLHISDLHFSHKLGGHAVDDWSARLPPLLSRNKEFDGFLGHHYKALSALHDFCKTLWLQQPEPLLVVTGDLTANGAEAQFDLAHGYLARKCPESAFDLGLGYDDWADISVTGNHDQWPGNNRVLGWPTAGVRKYFPKFPVVGPRIELRRNAYLRFVFVDSDADNYPFGPNRFFARGHFISQLTRLSNELSPPDPQEIRVLVIHHSLMNEGFADDVEQPAKQRRLKITNHSRKALERFIVDFDIKVMLSGHLHHPRLTVLEASNGTEESRVLTAMCGTTTMRDNYPYQLNIEGTRKLDSNTLVLHRIIERGASLFWSSEVFWRNRMQKFVSTSNYSSLVRRVSPAELLVS